MFLGQCVVCSLELDKLGMFGALVVCIIVTFSHEFSRDAFGFCLCKLLR